MAMKRLMVAFLIQLLLATWLRFTRRARLEDENLILRQQLVVLRRKSPAKWDLTGTPNGGCQQSVERLPRPERYRELLFSTPCQQERQVRAVYRRWLHGTVTKAECTYETSNHAL